MTAFEQFLAGKPLVFASWYVKQAKALGVGVRVATWDGRIVTFRSFRDEKTPFRIAVSEEFIEHWFDRLHSAQRQCWIEAEIGG